MIHKIRPHHGLCLNFYEGRGYSNEFTNHMSWVQDSLIKGALVEIVSYADDICAECPNCQNGVCRQQSAVEEYDRCVASICGFKENSIMPFTAFQDIVADKILGKGLLPSICGNCQWYSLCGDSQRSTAP